MWPWFALDTGRWVSARNRYQAPERFGARSRAPPAEAGVDPVQNRFVLAEPIRHSNVVKHHSSGAANASRLLATHEGELAAVGRVPLEGANQSANGQA